MQSDPYRESLKFIYKLKQYIKNIHLFLAYNASTTLKSDMSRNAHN